MMSVCEHCGDALGSNPSCPEHAAYTPKPPADWMSGAMAKEWGPWLWDLDSFREAQRWGDSNGCRLILVSEHADGDASYRLQLYISPKPNRRLTGLCEHSIANRDKGMERFGPWLEGFLSGRGVIKPGERIWT